ncbi:MAG: dUTP diphosphatase [Fusobacteriaceae bacterium]
MLHIEKLYEYQNILDGKIKESKGDKYKERTLAKIKWSINGEMQEFQEELEETHKTWKEKEFSKEKQLEEFVDILFFVLQALKVSFSPRIGYYKSIGSTDLDVTTLLTIMAIDNFSGRFDSLLENYMLIAGKMGYTAKMIEAEYMRKFDKNLERVEREWKTGIKEGV